MKIFYVVCIWMFLAGYKVSSIDIYMHGYSGKDVIISCDHSWASTNVKYFCKNPCNYGDILASSDRSPTGRFRLRDFRNGVFTVTITDLRESDSGIYWCAVSRFLKDTYHEVYLRVYKAITPTSTVLDTTHPFSTPQPETQFAKTSRTSRYSTPDDITTSSSLTAITHPSTKLDTTHPFFTSTPQPETPFGTSIKTPRYSIPDDITTSVTANTLTSTVDTTHLISIPTPQPETPFATSSRTSRYLTPDDITTSSSLMTIIPTSTKLDTTHPFLTSTPQPETPFGTLSRTSRYSTPDDITTSSSLTAITPTSTVLDTTQPLSTATPQPESQFATSSRTSRYSTPDNITTSSSLTAAVNVSLYAVGGLIAVILLICVLVTAVYRYRKRIKTSDDDIYENELQGPPNSKQIKSKKLKPEIPKSIKLSVYENITLNPGHPDNIYQNL